MPARLSLQNQCSYCLLLKVLTANGSQLSWGIVINSRLSILGNLTQDYIPSLGAVRIPKAGWCRWHRFVPLPHVNTTLAIPIPVLSIGSPKVSVPLSSSAPTHLQWTFLGALSNKLPAQTFPLRVLSQGSQASKYMWLQFIWHSVFTGNEGIITISTSSYCCKSQQAKLVKELCKL